MIATTMGDHTSAGLSGVPALVLAVALVALNGFFVAAEFALVRTRPERLRPLAARGDRRAARALALVDRLNEALSICQVGVTFCSLALGYVAEPAFAKIFAAGLRALGASAAALAALQTLAAPIAVAASFLLMTFLLVVAGELLPKQLAIGAAERTALALAAPLALCGVVFRPFVALLNGAARLALRAVRSKPPAGNHRRSLEDLRQILFLSAQDGELNPLETKLLHNFFRFVRGQARDAMVPRARVRTFDRRDDPREALARARRFGFSRFPLVDGDLDRLLGVVHVKDLIRTGEALPSLAEVARPALVVPDALPLERLLRRFQAERTHLAVVADEFGAAVGIVTLEDVLEELVGEMRDEFDAAEQDQIRPRPEGGFALDPALPLDRAAELVSDAPPAPEGVRTVAGLLQSRLGRIPAAGDRVPFGERHDLVVAAANGTRVLRIDLVPRVGDA